jgi:hypothetical protein
MTDWALVAVLASLFFWGLVRGTTICLSICVPGLLPYLAEKPRGAWGGAKFGLLLCLPRLVIFTIIGFIWGAVSYTIFSSAAFEDAAIWIYVVGYMVLGGIIVVMGLGMFVKAAKAKDELRKERERERAMEETPSDQGTSDGIPVGTPATSAQAVPAEDCEGPSSERAHKASMSITNTLLRFVPASSRGERTFVLVWGSILGLTCMLEVSLLEITVLGGAAANLAEGTLNAALVGGLAMFLFALGATIPMVISSAAFAAYIDRVETQDKMISIRVTGSLVMVLIGGMLFIRYLFLLIALLESGEV